LASRAASFTSTQARWRGWGQGWATGPEGAVGGGSETGQASDMRDQRAQRVGMAANRTGQRP